MKRLYSGWKKVINKIQADDLASKFFWIKNFYFSFHLFAKRLLLGRGKIRYLDKNKWLLGPWLEVTVTGRFFYEDLTIVLVETFSTGRRLGGGRSGGSSSTLVIILSYKKIWKIKLHLYFFYPQLVYRQLALEWKISKQLWGLNPLSLSIDKNYRLKKSGVFPLQQT